MTNRLPGLRAFSRRTVHAIEALDVALSQENVTDAANACHWLMDELEGVRDNLIDLMRSMPRVPAAEAIRQAREQASERRTG